MLTSDVLITNGSSVVTSDLELRMKPASSEMRVWEPTIMLLTIV